MSKPEKINVDIKKRVKEYERVLEKTGKDLELEPVITIEFPQYRVLPDDLLLALRVIEGHGRKFMLSYRDLKNEH